MMHKRLTVILVAMGTLLVCAVAMAKPVFADEAAAGGSIAVSSAAALGIAGSDPAATPADQLSSESSAVDDPTVEPASVQSDNVSTAAAESGDAWFRSSSYRLFAGMKSIKTWEQAEAYCKSIGGHLAVIGDSAENTFLYDFMIKRGAESAYFGYTDSGSEGHWRWVNGAKATYTNWADGEPNNERGAENYAMFYYKFAYAWNDGDYGEGTVNDPCNFICEWDHPFMVSFNANGGSKVPSAPVIRGKKVSQPVDPTRSGYTFAGWYKDAKLTQRFDFNAAIWGNVTLYAKWVVNTGFKDVAPTDWVYAQGWLSYATKYIPMTGYPNGNFGPEDDITRGQVAAILYRIANPKSDATTNPKHYGTSTGFKDGGTQRYYFAAVKWLKMKGVVTGDKDEAGRLLNTFRPDAPITRQELSAMTHRFAQVMKVNVSGVSTSVLNKFRDGDQVQPYAREAMAWCNARGVITGGQGAAAGLLMPGQNATRAQAAKIFTVLHRDVMKR